MNTVGVDMMKNDPLSAAISFLVSILFISFSNRTIAIQWLALVSLAVLYNIIFVVGRAVFWEINRNVPALWWTLDYLCDAIYIIDILVHCHEGKFGFVFFFSEKLNPTQEGRNGEREPIQY